MAFKSVAINDFSGGIASSEKEGIKNSMQLIQNLNIQEDPAYITLSPASSKISASTVTNLPLWFADGRPYDTNVYAYDLGGNIYKITSSNVVTLDRAVGVGSAAGQGLAVFQNTLLYATDTTLGRKGLLNNSPSYSGAGFGDDFLSDGSQNLDQNQVTSGQTYTLPTTIIEDANDSMYFNQATGTPKVAGAIQDPIKEIDVLLAGKGTGAWTLTLHDQYNNNLGSVTVPNGSLVSGGNYQPFIFSTPVRVLPNGTYHFHLTQPTNDGTVTTGTTSDLQTVAFNEYFGILIGGTTYHPIEFVSGSDIAVIGNANYLASWNNAVYLPNNIGLDQGYYVRSLHQEDQYIVAEAWRVGSDSVSDRGKLYYWDGIQTAVNYAYDLPEGRPNVAFGFKNRTFHVLGQKGELYAGTEPYQKIQTLDSLLARGKTIEVAPGGMTVWNSRLFTTFGKAVTDPAFPTGIYGYGNMNEQFPEVLTEDFLCSTGNTTGVNFAAILAVGPNLYIGWNDTNTSAFGIDVITLSGNAATSGTLQSLQEDFDNPQKTKLFLELVITFQPLNAGESVTPIYAFDRTTTFTSGTKVSAVNSVRAEQVLNTRFREMQYGFILGSTNGTFPKVTGIVLDYDDLSEEEVYKS